MQATPTSLPHSCMGIASFIMSLMAGAGLLITFGIAGALESRPGGLNEESLLANMLGLLILLIALAQMIALGLGIAGMVQAGRSKLFGVLGTVFASTALLGSLLLVLLGAVLEA